jgi:glucose/arabinose dehydrogenase
VHNDLVPKPKLKRRAPLPLVCALAAVLLVPAWLGADETVGNNSTRRVPWTSSRLVGSPEPPLPYTTTRVFTQLELPAPLYLVPEPASDRLWAVLHGNGDKPARIVRFVNRADVSEYDVLYEISNRLVYSVIFDPEFATNRHVYVFSNGPQNQAERSNRVSRLRFSDGETPRLDRDSELAILEWRSAGHDGGDMAFGSDGMLYLTTGDGTSDSDDWNSGQTLDDLLGAVLRIDVRHASAAEPYRVPPDNPFVKLPGARPEVFAYGLRNPWRMCIDAASGRIWVGNNGQDLWETAHLVRAGENYGWSVYEGNHPFYLERPRGPTPIVPPTIEHSHAEFRSLTGGVVYRSQQHRELDGVYFYGDYSSGRIWGMLHDGQRPRWHRELADTSLMIAAFCQDPHGRLLVVDHGGGIHELVPAPAPDESTPPFPSLLSETGLFADTAAHTVAPGVTGYTVNAPAWADGATAERFLAVPGHETVGYSHGRSWSFPDGTALVQTLSLSTGDAAGPRSRRIETRVLLKQQGEWAGYSYRWNDQQTDAMLVGREGDETHYALDSELEGERQHWWRFPSRVECMTCHSRAANFVLGITGIQLDRLSPGEPSVNQLESLAAIGLFKDRLPAQETPKHGHAAICTSTVRSAMWRPAAATPAWNWNLAHRVKRWS